jgi:hypothetical protein
VQTSAGPKTASVMLRGGLTVQLEEEAKRYALIMVLVGAIVVYGPLVLMSWYAAGRQQWSFFRKYVTAVVGSLIGVAIAVAALIGFAEVIYPTYLFDVGHKAGQFLVDGLASSLIGPLVLIPLGVRLLKKAGTQAAKTPAQRTEQTADDATSAMANATKQSVKDAALREQLIKLKSMFDHGLITKDVYEGAMQRMVNAATDEVF